MADIEVQKYIHSRHIQCDQLTAEQPQKLLGLRNTTNDLRQEIDNEATQFYNKQTGLQYKWEEFLKQVAAALGPGPDPDLRREAEDLLDEARALQLRLADIETRTLVVAQEINNLTLDILKPGNANFDKLLGNSLNRTFNAPQGLVVTIGAVSKAVPTDGLRLQVKHIIETIAQIYLEDPPCAYCTPVNDPEIVCV
ncbi:hypothetical protein HYR54_05325 [Candidatus Acetothermia bacterium]|nr:hypothetical protein [Candidatus Acetothermia bacterium]